MRSLFGLFVLLTACPSPTGPFDDDLDGFADDVDCDDSDPNVNPAAVEVCANQVDDDCDGVVDDDGQGAGVFYRDADEDTFGRDGDTVRACVAPDGYVSNNDDCDDEAYDINPRAADDDCDGVDENCNGRVDEDAPQIPVWADADGDGFGAGAESSDCAVGEGFADNADDCRDDDALAYPGAAERCNGFSDDCDGEIDEGVTGSGEACPAESCRAILAEQPDASTGRYWIAFDRAYELECEMGDKGWTVLTGEDLRALDLVEFRLVGGRAAAWYGDWVADASLGRFLLDPQRANRDRTDCETAVVRAEVRLPFDFTAWKGAFETTYWGQDNFSPSPATATKECNRGAFHLISGFDQAKPGNKWPDSNNDTYAWSWSEQSIGTTESQFYWELNGYSTSGIPRPGEENASVGEIRIAVH